MSGQLVIYFDHLIRDATKTEFINVVQSHAPSSILVFLNSEGGHPTAGQELYNFLTEQLDKSVDTHVINVGSVQSAAVPFFLGFKKREAHPNSTIMIHNTTWTGINNEKGDRHHWAERVKLLKRQDDIYKETILRACYPGCRTPLTKVQLDEMCDKETTFKSLDSLWHGFISDIVRTTVPNLPSVYRINPTTVRL